MTGGNKLVAAAKDEWEFLIDPPRVGEAIGLWRPEVKGGNWQTIKTSSRRGATRGCATTRGWRGTARRWTCRRTWPIIGPTNTRQPLLRIKVLLQPAGMGADACVRRVADSKRSRVLARVACPRPRPRNARGACFAAAESPSRRTTPRVV